MRRGPAAVAALALLLAPLLLALSGCGSGTGQLHVDISGQSTNYAANDARTYDSYKPGDQATFTVDIVNVGPGSVTGITVHVALPAGFRYHATSSIDSNGATRTQPLDAAVNSNAPIFGLWTLDPPSAAGNSNVAITFTAEVNGQPGTATVNAFAVGDTNAGQTNATGYNVQVTAAASLSALVSANPTTVRRGGTVTYEVRITNSGTGNAADVGVLVTLPSVMTFAGSVTPFAGNGSRHGGVNPIANTLEVFYDGFTLPPISAGGPGFVVVVFRATVPSTTGFSSPPTTTSGPTASPGAPPLSGPPFTVPPGTYAVDANITDAAGDTYSLHAVAPVTVSG